MLITYLISQFLYADLIPVWSAGVSASLEAGNEVPLALGSNQKLQLFSLKILQ